jgi:hypothetical protein
MTERRNFMKNQCPFMMLLLFIIALKGVNFTVSVPHGLGEEAIIIFQDIFTDTCTACS